MNGRHAHAAGPGPIALARRLWGRFELLPFRHGMALVAIAIAVPALLIGGVLMLGGGGTGSRPSPSPPGRSPAAAAVPTAPTWGEYVPPRQIRSTRMPAPRPSTAATTHPKTTRSASAAPHPSPTASCPSSLKKWPWVWDMCRHKQGRPGRS